MSDQLQPLPARGRVAGVVEVQQDRVEVVALGGSQHRGRRPGGLDGVALTLEQQAERLADIGLVVRDQDLRGRRGGRQRSLGWWVRAEI